jgi:hypothetical protein
MNALAHDSGGNNARGVRERDGDQREGGRELILVYPG